MTTQLICPGLNAGWLNAWLAAVGATVLDSRIRLHWSIDDSRAVLSSSGLEPVAFLIESWPTRETLADLPIAEYWHDCAAMRRKVEIGAFAERARAARDHPQSWALSSTMTDLGVDQNGEIAHAPFDPAGPGTIKWLHHRLMKVHAHTIPVSREQVLASLTGVADRVQDNGLGFDQGRLGSQSDTSTRWTDPVVEVLAFFGLAILPMRGRGTDGRMGYLGFQDQRQKNWIRSPGNRQSRRFHWPAWVQPLDAWGIDALLDQWDATNRNRWPILGVHAGWRTVAFQPQDRADTTRAFGAEQL